MPVNINIESVLTVGKIIQFHRRQAGLSRIELSNIAGVGKTVVYDIEKGKETVRFNTLLKVLYALNVTLTLDSSMMDRYEAADHAQR